MPLLLWLSRTEHPSLDYSSALVVQWSRRAKS